MRKGIISAGNYIVDRVKTISYWPEHGTLTDIIDEKTGNGGGAYNVIMDLAKMESGIPLYAAGVVGEDSDGNYILNDLKAHNIDCRYFHHTPHASTSYTDVMSEKNSPYRTFFHCRGANALLDYEHLHEIDVDAKLFFLGYLLLLDRFELDDPDYATRAAKILRMLQQKGLLIVVDLVSVENDQARRVVESCLPYIDYLIMNELEAGYFTDYELRDNNQKVYAERVEKAAKRLIQDGVNECVIIHYPEGAFAVTRDSQQYFVESYPVPINDIVGTTGAGDAFCAGFLFCLHEDKTLEYALQFAHASAHFNLYHETASGGAVKYTEIESFIKKHR